MDNNENPQSTDGSSTTGENSQQSEQQEISNQQNIALSKKEIHRMITSGDYSHNRKTFGRDGRDVKAPCWEILHEIYDSDRKVIPNFYFCIKCKEVIHNAYKNGNTNKLNRHTCQKKIGRHFTQKDKEKLKFAAAKFIADDLRPYNAVEGKGFKALCLELMRFGQRHAKATEVDLEEVLPCRNTVRDGVKVMSDQSRDFIRNEIQKVKRTFKFCIVIRIMTHRL